MRKVDRINLIVIFISLFLTSCGEKTLRNIGLKQEEIDSFSVSRKQALDMPPDMILRPPGTEEKIKKNKNTSNINTISDLSLDEILLGEKPIKKKNKFTSKKIKIKNKDIVYRILKARANKILK